MGGSFLGRADEMSELALLLDAARLVTLSGPPGIGKSRLALESAGVLAEGYRDGTCLVELAPVGHAALVPRAIAGALSLPEVPGQGLRDSILTRLAHRHMLLVLDNCEHLLDACGDLVGTLLGACPELTVLATSREPLAIAGEAVYTVPPLSVPDRSELEPEELTRYDAVRLFVERSRSAQAGFALNAYVAPAVAQICHELDGVPLAIELAAARVETLTPAEIARRLDDRFALLANGNAGALPRRKTLLGALDWSHELLEPSERALLRRLAVFLGGLDLEAAEAVCPGGELARSDVADVLARLVSKSLVVAEPESAVGSRYRLLETVRVYASERLEEAGETATLRAAHAHFYLARAERGEPELTGPRQAEWLEALELERENFRSAFDWSLGHGQSEWALRLAGALVLFWRVRCHFSEGRGLIEAALSGSENGSHPLRAKALWGAGFLALMTGDLGRAIPALEESLARFRELGDLQGQARSLLILGNASQAVNDPRTLPALEESTSLARRAGDHWCLAHALGVAGFERTRRDELALAHELLRECLEVSREAEDEQGLRIGLLGLASVTVREGDYGLTRSLLEEALQIGDDLGESYGRATALRYLGEVALGRGDYVHARELLEASLELLREGAPPASFLPVLALLAKCARAEGDRARAQRLLDQAVSTGKSADVVQGAGELAAETGDLVTARGFFEEALTRSRDSGAKEATANALFALAELARGDGDRKRAATLHEEALDLYRGLGTVPRIVASLEAIAGLDPAVTGHEQSARLLGAAQALRDANGYARTPAEASRHDSDVALLEEPLGVEGLETARSKGGRMSIEEAAALAARLTRARARLDGGWAALSRTERKVAELAAEGLTNPEIAERLYIARGTVKSHLSHIFQKLGVAGRTQLARELWREANEA